MEKNQLRTGNIIQTESAIYRVENICGGRWGLYCYDIKTGEGMCVSVENAQPVPLTEEWLLRFGFDNTTDDGQETTCYFKQDVDLIGVDVTPDKLGLVNEYSLELYRDIIDSDGEYSSEHAITLNSELKHVHQLQNLYFALTGKELAYESL